MARPDADLSGPVSTVATAAPDKSAFAVDFAAFVVVLGIPDGALGVLWPGMRGTFHRALGDLGYVAVAGTLLYLLGGVVYAWLSGRVPNRVLIVAACAASAITAGAWALAGSWLWLLMAFGGFGIGRGALDAAVNADAAHQIKRLGWLHAGWSVGGAIGPLLVAGLAHVASWRLPVAIVAVAAVAVTAPAGISARVATYDGTSAAARHGSTKMPPMRAGLVLVTFAFYTAAEIGPCAWGYVYLTDHRHLSSTVAAVAVALFWIALTAGRIALGVFGERADARTLLVGSCSLLAGALALLWLAPAEVGLVAMPLAGVGSAAVFPVLVNVTPSVVGVGAADRAIGLSIAAAAIGGPLAVLIEGLIVNGSNAGVLAPAMLVVAVALLAPIAFLVRLLPDPP
jgi:fucose permease